MNFKSRMQDSKWGTNSTSNGRLLSGRLWLRGKNLKCLAEFDGVSMLYDRASADQVYSESGGSNDDTSSISSCSTNATMDNIPGPGRAIDMYFYQPVGRAIEKFALNIGMRLNICHPSPAQILHFIIGYKAMLLFGIGDVKIPSDAITEFSAERPTHLPGLLSLVQQSQ